MFAANVNCACASDDNSSDEKVSTSDTGWHGIAHRLISYSRLLLALAFHGLAQLRIALNKGVSRARIYSAIHEETAVPYVVQPDDKLPKTVRHARVVRWKKQRAHDHDVATHDGKRAPDPHVERLIPGLLYRWRKPILLHTHQ